MSREYSVLVTGFGANLNAPYGNSSSNPAGLIARNLPASLPAGHALNSADANINILDAVAGGFDAIAGEMGVIRKRLQELHVEHGGKVDLWVHLGRGPWEFVTCERLAFRQDFSSSWLNDEAQKAYYLGRDNVGQNAHDLGPCPWTEVPIGLNTEMDVGSIVPDAAKRLSEYCELSGSLKTPLEVRSHLEAGPGGCGFCFYESMANCFALGRRRNVLFVHMPRHTDAGSLSQARDAVLAVIGASIATLVRRQTAPPMDYKTHFGEFR
ncbi:MAG: hypothetical protein Q9159_006192 [Coniocarpon cinnabarinum]